jgi:hypothetical protein
MKVPSTMPRFLLVLLLLSALTQRLPGQEETRGPAAFLAWARSSASPVATALPSSETGDLAPLRAIVGTARVVGVGESAHGIREFIGLRQRIAQFLVEEMGSPPCIESGCLIADRLHVMAAPCLPGSGRGIT